MQMACCPHVSRLIRFVSAKMTDDWFEAMDQGLYTGAIFLDLRKAFNVVNLDLLANVWLLLVSITVAKELIVRPSTVCQHYRNLI